MNKAILIGNLTRDPEYRTTQSGIGHCSMTLAVQRRFANAEGKREADFFTVIAWRNLADFCSQYLSKGRKIAVEGSLQTRSYDAQDGSKRYVTEVIAENIECTDSRREQPPIGEPPPEKPRQTHMSDAQNQEFVEVEDEELPF